MSVIIKPTTRIKKMILETRQPALAAPLNPNIPAIIDSTKNIIANVKSEVNISTPIKVIN
jgi:hypothetical protein